MGWREREAGRGRRRRAATTPTGSDAVAAAEAAFLREELVRVRLEEQRIIGVGSGMERIRELTSVQRSGADDGDDAYKVLSDALVLRESLLDICDVTEQAIVNLRRQLKMLDCVRPELLTLVAEADAS